jgi:hypothetical protein
MYTSEEIITPYRDWLLTYPYGFPMNHARFDISRIEDSMRLSNNEGNALRYDRKVLRQKPYIDGSVVEQWTNNLTVLSFRNYINDDNQRRMNVEAFNQFVLWLHEDTAERPRYSNMNEDYYEIMYSGEIGLIDDETTGWGGMAYTVDIVHRYNVLVAR